MASHHSLDCIRLTLFLLTTHFPTNYAQLETITQPEVTISQGTLLGTTLTSRNGRNIFAFVGIPYGQPPIKNLRFANPMPAIGWNETLNATTDPSKCPQIVSGVVVGDEDCLFVKVYTPKLPQNGTNSSLLPVMVWIHGGAFRRENPDQNTPEYLLDADVVLVVVNYRLGPLGFLSTGDEVASGNWGLKDQVLALEWVQDNVHHFGGDPDQVTLFGESAGSVSVHLLTLSNSTIGLFHRYITQSGSALAAWSHRPRAAYSNRAFELGEFVGCFNDTSAFLIHCLREIDFSDIIDSESMYLVSGSHLDAVWGPTDEPDIEGAILTDSPANLFAAGKIRDLPWISGVVRDEGLLHSVEYYENEEMLYDFLEKFDVRLPLMLNWRYEPDLWASRINAVKSYYFNNDLTSNTSEVLKNLTMLLGDANFFYPAYIAVQQQNAVAANPQYFYFFSYRGTLSSTFIVTGSVENYGIRHSDDGIYIFPKEAVFLKYNKTMSETDYEMVDTMVQLWTSFAINGKPTASALESAGITWGSYSSDDNYLRIGNESNVGLELQYSFFKKRMEFWANIDAIVDTKDDSGAASSSPNLLLLLLIVVCSKLDS